MNTSSFLIFLGLLLPYCGTATAQDALFSQGATITLTGGGSLNVRGDSHFQAGSVFTNNGNLSVSGNLTNDYSMTAASAGTVTFNGSSTQTINGIGTYLVKNLVVNNPAGIILNTPLKADGSVLLTTGIVSTASALSPLILTASASVNGVSDISHINGYVRREGTGIFSYPVGNGIRYQPVSVDLDENSSGLQVRYYSSDAGSAAFVTTGASGTALEAYNNQEYWDLNPVGTAGGRVTIFRDETNNPSITSSTNINVFKVAHKTASGWLNEGSASVTGSISSGSVTSEKIFSWSPFTLGVISQSALPVTLVSFQARVVENKALIEWSTSLEDNASHFDVERSTDARHFEKVGSVTAKGNSDALSNYSLIDTPFFGGIIYYRLRSVDLDGSSSLSRAISLKFSDQVYSSNMYPNPVPKNATVTLESVIKADQISVWNTLGRKMPANVKLLPNGISEISTSGFDDGLYIIRVDTKYNSIYHKLIVQ